MADITLEICVDNAHGLQTAIEAGADRIELCSALAVGGLTPSPGLMALAGQANIPVFAMIRPRSGPFVADRDDLKVMVADIEAARRAGLAGIVVGLLDQTNHLDVAGLSVLLKAAEDMSVTLHRAFDCIPEANRTDALETTIGLGFHRILTSGGKQTAPEAASQLSELVRRANGRIIILPGSGIRPETIGGLLASVPATELHASCSMMVPGREDERFGFGPERRTDGNLIRALKAAIAIHQAGMKG